jgi:hypothetical protein
MSLGHAQRFYRIGLQAYPRCFRAHYAEEMLRVFAEGLHEARNEGFRQTVRYCAKASADLVRSAMRERMAAMDGKSGLLSLAAMACGWYATYVDFHATEVQATLLVILLGSFLLGSLAPKRAWRSALLAAVWLPTVQVIAFAMRHAGPGPGHPYWSRIMILLPTLAASLLGACGGVLFRLICREFAETFGSDTHKGPTLKA